MVRKKLFHLLIPIVGLMFLGMATVVYAVTITIDGVQETAWTSGSGGAIPGVGTDPDETGAGTANIDNGVDVQTVRYTNDATYFYVLIETYDQTILNQSGPDPYVIICFNTDGNTATPGGSDDFADCDGSTATSMDGIERIVEIFPLVGAGYTIYEGDYLTTVATDDGSSVATSGSITEVRIPLANLGFSGGGCAASMEIAIYFDGASSQADDNTPDSGSLTATCGTPTAVTLQAFGTQSTQDPTALFVIGFALLLVSTGAAVVIIKRNQLD